MVQTERKDKSEFNPITLTIESQKELDFLKGVFDAGEEEIKENFEDFDRELDIEFYNEIYRWK